MNDPYVNYPPISKRIVEENKRSKAMELISALDVAVPRYWAEQDWRLRVLAKSLVCYVSEDDMQLSRAAFLRTVIDRIQSDLDHGEQ